MRNAAEECLSTDERGSVRATFLVDGMQVCLSAPDPALGPVLSHIVGHFGTKGAPDSTSGQIALSVRVTSDELALPAGALKLAALDGGISVWQAGNFLYLAAPDALLLIDGAREHAVLRLHPRVQNEPETLQNRVFMLWMLGLFIMLRRHGLYTAHCAALVSPEGAGTLVVASSGCGKSTLSYMLARSGWAFLTDDTAVLKAVGEEIAALGFRRHFGLHHHTKDYFPELDVEWEAHMGDGQKWAIPMQALYPEQVQASCVPRALIFPEIAGRPESRLIPITKAEALRLMVAQSSLLLLEPNQARPHLDVLSRLVVQSVHYRLEAGRDVLEQPRKVEQMLRTAIKKPLSC